MVESFTDYFGPRAIIGELIRLRTATARKRHEAVFLARISRLADDPEETVPARVDHLLPPRRQWLRPRADKRAGLSRDVVNGMAIARTVSAQSSHGGLAACDWGKRLLTFIESVREAAMSGASIERPSIHLQGKDREKKTYRPIAVYDRIEDRVLLGLTARYLRSLFDDDLLPSVYAFRAKPSFSHTAAVRNLRAYRLGHDGVALYTAECDIQKFFDTVNHKVALDAVDQAAERLKERGKKLDDRAVAIVKRYLNSYTFPEAQREGEARLREKGREGTIEWLDSDTLKRLYQHPEAERLGIPQGGALSPLLANLILDAADRAVSAACGADDAFYARFCDDMILVHPNRARCRAIFESYQEALSALKVAVHRPKEVTRYDATFYGAKSKGPYAWGKTDGRKKVVPWVSFLGYQVKHDGKMRIRPSSVRREHDKQIRVVGQVLRLVDMGAESLRLPAEEIVERTHLRLIAMSVGLNKLRVEGMARRQPCWADAFFLLEANESSTGQLRQLDRNRERQVRRLVRRLRRGGLLEMPGAKEPGKEGGSPKFYGGPYSYHSAVGPSEREDVRIPVKEAYPS